MANALSREQVADALYQAGFRGQDLINMVAIAGRESGYQPAAHRTDQPKDKLSGDMGLFQINYVNWPTVSKALGLTNKRQLFDPVINAKAAKVLHDMNGYGPWAAGPGGWTAGGDPFYKTNRGAASTAVQNYLAQPNQYRVGSGNTATTDGGASTNAGAARDGESYATGGGAQRPELEAPQLAYDEYTREPIEDYKPPEVDVEAQAGLTTLLEGFGIDYPSAPRATPQLLAFLRGLGVQVDTAEEQYDTAIEGLQRRRSDSMGELAISDQRRRRSLATDAQRRGALTSGATNTSFARQAEDVARSGADIQRQYAEGSDAAQAAYDTAVGGYRQRALETVLNEDTRQQTYDAEQQARVEALRRQQEENDLTYKRQREAEQARIDAQVALYNQGYR